MVALAGRTLVGFAAITASDDPDANPRRDALIAELAVQPDATRAGHGSRLLNAVVDTIRGSRHPNMKELRAGSMRALFAFDPLRQAIVLVGGDKRDDWTGWHERNIPLADDMLDAHLDSLREDLP